MSAAHDARRANICTREAFHPASAAANRMHDFHVEILHTGSEQFAALEQPPPIDAHDDIMVLAPKMTVRALLAVAMPCVNDRAGVRFHVADEVNHDIGDM